MGARICGTSPRAIQDRAGVGQGSMYHHFRSKAALAQAAEERSAAELIEEVRHYLMAWAIRWTGCWPI